MSIQISDNMFSGRDDSSPYIDKNGVLQCKGYLTEFRNFPMTTIVPEGWHIRDGARIDNVSILYPKLIEALHSDQFNWFLATLTNWNTWRGRNAGYGGCPLFCHVESEDYLLLPDTRGDFVRDSYCGRNGDYGCVWTQDQIVNIYGEIGWNSWKIFSRANGVFSGVTSSIANTVNDRSTEKDIPYIYAKFDASRVVNTGDQVQPRNYTTIPCVYIGSPKI